MADRFSARVTWSLQEGKFVAEVPELKGCRATGDTRSAALAAVEQKIAAWLAVAKEDDRPVPQAEFYTGPPSDHATCARCGRTYAPLARFAGPLPPQGDASDREKLRERALKAASEKPDMICACGTRIRW